MLQEYVDNYLLLAINSLSSSSEVCVSVSGVKSQMLTMSVRPQQGCVLSQLLFTVHMNWADSHNWVKECHWWKLQDQSLFVDDLVLLVFSERVFNNIALYQFSAECEHAEMKTGTKQTKVVCGYVSAEIQTSVFCKSTDMHSSRCLMPSWLWANKTIRGCLKLIQY